MVELLSLPHIIIDGRRVGKSTHHWAPDDTDALGAFNVGQAPLIASACKTRQGVIREMNDIVVLVDAPKEAIVAP